MLTHGGLHMLLMIGHYKKHDNVVYENSGNNIKTGVTLLDKLGIVL